MKEWPENKDHLLEELVGMRQRVAELEALESQRKREEEALRKSEERYRLVAENATDLVWTMDMNLMLTYISPSVTRIRGYSVEEAMALRLDQVLTPSSYQFAIEVLEEELASERAGRSDPDRTRTLELEHICKDGSTVWSEAKMKFLRGPDGQPVGILGVTRDITERKLAEEKVRQYLEDLTLLSRAAIGFVELEPDEDIYVFIGERLRELVPDSIVMVNSYDPATDSVCVRAILGMGKKLQKGMRILGRSPVGMTFRMSEQGRGPLMSGRFHKVPGGLHELSFGWLPRAICRAIENALGLGEIHAMGFVREGQLYGDVIIVLPRGAHLRNQEVVETFINQASVALQRKRAEESLARERNLLRTLMDSLPDYIYVKDTAGRFVTTNAAHLEALGARRLDEVVGKMDAHFLPAEEAKRSYADDQRVVLSGQSLLNKEELVRDRQNREKWLLTTKVPLRDSNGAIAGLVAMSRDVTERRRAEEEKRRLQAQLAHAQKMEALGALAGGIAHEFNNINAIIMGYVELTLQNEKLSESVRRNLEIVRTSVARGASLTKSLLAFSRREIGERKPVSLRDVVEEVLRITEKELTSEGIELDVKHSIGVPPVVGDAGMLASVVMNLVVNARHAMLKSEMRKLTVETGLDKGRAFVRVSDTGCGIPREDIPKLFEPFFTTKGALAAGEVYDGKARGTGLGLSVCHSIVEGHGGEIKVDSQVCQGTTFTVYFPAASKGEASRRKVDEGPKEEAPRILIVDDEEAITELLAEILGHNGYPSDAFTDPKEALRAVSGGQYSLAFIDLQMPGMRGEDLIGKVNDLPPEKRPLPVVLTGRLDFSERDLNRLGVSATLQKPFSTKEVLEIVRKGIAARERSGKERRDSERSDGP